MVNKRLIYGKPILDLNDIYSALDSCHQIGIQTVIVSSSKTFDQTNSEHDNNHLVLFASSKSNLFSFFLPLYVLINCYMLKR